MKALARTLVVLTIALGGPLPVVAQQQVAYNRPPASPGAPSGPAAPAPAAVSSSAAERLAQQKLLLQRLGALKKYLTTLGPTSPDYRATESAIRALEGQLKSLAEVSPERRGPAAHAAAPGLTNRFAPAARQPAPEAVPGGPPSARGNLFKPPAPTAARAQDEPKECAKPGENADEEPGDYVSWLNQLVCDRALIKAQALIDQGSNANQTESPSEADNSTSLVDQSSASDLVGVALNLPALAGISGGDDEGEENPSVSVTATAYSLYALFKNADALDPEFYNRHRDWRRFSFTLGYDKGESTETTDDDEVATIAGVKVLILANRDASANVNELDSIRNHLRTAGVAFAGVNNEVRAFLFTRDQVRRDVIRPAFRAFVERNLSDKNADLMNRLGRDASFRLDASKSLDENINAFLATSTDETLKGQVRRLIEQREVYQEALKPENLENRANLLLISDRNSWGPAEEEFFRVGFGRTVLRNQANFKSVLDNLTAGEREELNRLVDDRINPFVELDRATRNALDRIRGKSQLSAAFLSKTRDKGNDEYKGEIIYEKGLPTGRINLTLNAGFKYVDSKTIGGDSRGGNLSGQLQFRLTPENRLISKSPIYFYLSTNNEWLSGKKPTYKGQAKLKIPVADGVEIPISFTVANRTELVDEKEVKGQFGFTFDTARLFRLFKFKPPAADGGASAAPGQ